MIHLRYVIGAVTDSRALHEDLVSVDIPLFGISTYVDATSAITTVHVDDKISEKQKIAIDDAVREAEKVERSELPVELAPAESAELPSTEERT